MSEEIHYGCLRKIDRHSPNLAKMTNIVEDNHRQLYMILFSKKRMIRESEHQKVKEAYLNNGIILCKFSYIDIPDTERKNIQIIDVIQDIKLELKSLKSQHVKLALSKSFQEQRDANRETCKMEMIAKLDKLGVKNALQLCMIPPVHFQEMFGKKIVSTIIGRTAGTSRHLTKEDLLDLANALGWNLRNDVKHELMEKAGICDIKTLLDCGPKKFMRIFKCRMLSLFIEFKDKPSETNLIEFGQYLGWELPSLIKDLLERKGITSAIDVLRSTRGKFRDINTYIGKHLRKTIRDISQEERYLLCQIIKYDIPKEISDVIKQSVKDGASVFEAIKSLGFNDTIGIIYDFLPQITKELGYDPLQMMCDELRNQLRTKRGVSCLSTYMNNVTAKEISRFGLLRLGLLLGHSVKMFYSKEKRELGEVLGYVV